MSPGEPEPSSYTGNQQHVQEGVAIAGSVTGPVTLNYYAADEAADEVVKPRYRQGPYLAEEVDERLRHFVEPPSYPQCRRVLERRVLLLRGGRGSGRSTTAFALLRERCGPAGIIGLVSAENPSRWPLTGEHGYLVQGLPVETAEQLDEVLLTAIADRLRQTGGYLVVVLDEQIPLPRDTLPWQARHWPPAPYDVARFRLRRLADGGRLSPEELDTALHHLGEPEFKNQLSDSTSPAAGVDVADELQEVARGNQSAAEAAENLRLSGAKAAQELLAEARGDADRLALMAAVAVLEHQDRTVVESAAALLRGLLAERAAPHATRPAEPDLLGPSLADRLGKIDAQLLSRRVEQVGGYRYWVQPVAFRGRHQAEAILTQLWLDHEGLADVLRTWLSKANQPRLDYLAGRALGRVLSRATGANALRQLSDFARSSLRWHRRLAAYALGEVAQDTMLLGAVRHQLRNWSQVQNPQLRCTVAETCAGGFGLAQPDFALSLLDAVLDHPAGTVEQPVLTAVSYALGVLLTEDRNRAAVLKRLSQWFGGPAGTLRHDYAVSAFAALLQSGFPESARAGTGRIMLADLVAEAPELLVAPVLAALDNRTLHEPMALALSSLEQSADPLLRGQYHAFLQRLADDSGGRRGVLSFLLARYRSRMAAPAEGIAS